MLVRVTVFTASLALTLGCAAPLEQVPCPAAAPVPVAGPRLRLNWSTRSNGMRHIAKRPSLEDRTRRANPERPRLDERLTRAETTP
jgi:hypothetical protein